MSAKISFLSTATLAVLLSASPALASNVSNNQVLRDSNGQVVSAIGSGTCVRTFWEAGQDPCQTTRRVVSSELNSTERVAYFEFNKATLTPSAKKQLDNVAKKLKAATDVESANIVGYADRIGSSDYNQKLSQRRAKAVKDYLAKRGYLNTNVTEVRAVGESEPSTNCDASLPKSREIACLAPDRRVEIEVQYVTQHQLTLISPVTRYQSRQ